MKADFHARRQLYKELPRRQRSRPKHQDGGFEQVADALKFAEGSAPLATLRAATERAWRELQNDEALRDSLIARDPGLSGLFGSDRSPYEISAASAGIEPLGTAILIGLGAWASQVTAGVAQEIVLDAWRDVILPRIKERLGSDAVGSEDEDK